MGLKGTISQKEDNNFRSYTNALKSTACEWLLLFLLLIDAVFSYFITKFAQYCQLQLPCMLCSRLDHALGNEKPDFYRNLICNDHRSEISSLVVCHNHYNLADVHEMCEECLLSFAKKESSQEIYKILVGKLGSDCLQKPFLSIDSVPGPMSTRFCSCCAKTWRSRPNVHKLIQSPGPVSKPDIPLPKSPARRSLNRQEGLKKRKDRFSASTTPFVIGSTDFDSLSHVGYTEVKINSDSESDFLFSDDEEFTMPRDRKGVKVDRISQRESKLFAKKQFDDFHPTRVFPKSNHSKSNVVNVDLESENDETTTPKFLASNGDVNHEDSKWKRIREKVRPVVPVCNALEDFPLSASAPEMSPALSADESERVTLSKHFVASGFHDLVFHDNAFPSRGIQLPIRLSKEKWAGLKGNGDIEHTSAMNNWESIDLNSTTTSNAIGNDRKDVLSLTDTCSAVGAGDLSPSCRADIKFLEPTTSKTDLYQTINEHPDEMQIGDASSSIESPMPPKSPSFERSHSLESFQRSVSAIEAEKLVEKLKQQKEQDKECINNLYKELEEERNASAIAANQAMAMITKLQEEKSALHMEALQYLRMLEEQAEFDVDEIEKGNEMNAEKDRVIQDLEAELDYFKIKYPEEFPDDYGDQISVCVLNELTSNAENINVEES